MFRILRAHGQLLNWTGQTYWSASDGCGGDLEEDDGQVCAQGSWALGEGNL